MRKLCRIESARIRQAARQEILDTRYTDSKLFYKPIDKQRGKLKFCVNELSAGEATYSSASRVLTGWKGVPKYRKDPERREKTRKDTKRPGKAQKEAERRKTTAKRPRKLTKRPPKM